MFRRLKKTNKKGQNTAEYAILIALVVAAIIAMQTYAQRALQARVRDTAKFMADQTPELDLGGETIYQYEPYYLQSEYDVSRNAIDTTSLDKGHVGLRGQTNRFRTGSQRSMYCGTAGEL